MSDPFGPNVSADDAAALDGLAAAGVGDGDFGESHDVHADLVELQEVIEYGSAAEDDDQ